MEKLIHTKESCHIWTHFQVYINKIIIPPFSLLQKYLFFNNNNNNCGSHEKNYNFKVWGCHFAIIGYSWIVRKLATFIYTLDPARMMMCPRGSHLHWLGLYDPLGIRVQLVQVLHVCIVIEATFANISSNLIQENFSFLECLGNPTIRDKTIWLVASSHSLQINPFNRLGNSSQHRKFITQICYGYTLLYFSPLLNVPNR